MKRNTIKKATIESTSTPNFFTVVSSDGYTHYPLMLTAPGACLCGCPAATPIYDEKGNLRKPAYNCKHRAYALQTLEYVPVVEDSIDEFTLARINRIEDEAERDAVRAMYDEDLPPAA